MLITHLEGRKEGRKEGGYYICVNDRSTIVKVKAPLL